MKRQHPIYLVLMGVILILIFVGLLLHYQWKNPEAKLVLATAQPGGVYVEIGAEFKSLIEEHLNNVTVDLLTTAGSVANVEHINSGGAHLALVQNDILGSSKLRTIAPLHRDYLHFIVRKDSGIKGLRDLSGKTLTTGLAGSGSLPIVTALLKYFSVSDTQIKKLTIHEGIADLKNGKTDALMLVLGFRSPAVMDIFKDSHDKVEFVKLPEIEQEALKGFVLSYPICETIDLPPFSYSTAPELPIATLAVQTLLVAHSDVPVQIIREITEVLFTHRSKLIHRHPAAAQMTESFSGSSVSFPIHPGARQYFSREEPGFITRYAETMAFVLSLVLASYGLFRATTKWISQKQKDRIDRYYIELEKYLTQLENESNLSSEKRDEIDLAVKRIRRDAFNLLAVEKLIPDASFRILQHLLEQCARKIEQLKK